MASRAVDTITPVKGSPAVSTAAPKSECAPLERMAPEWIRVNSTGRLPAKFSSLKKLHVVEKTLGVVRPCLPQRIADAVSELVKHMEVYVLFHEVTITVQSREVTVPLLFISDEAIESADSARVWLESKRAIIEQYALERKNGVVANVRDTINPLFEEELPETQSMRLLLSESSRRVYVASASTTFADLRTLLTTQLDVHTGLLSRLPARDVLLSSTPVQTAISMAEEWYRSESNWLREAAKFGMAVAIRAMELGFEAALFVFAMCMVPVNYASGLLRFYLALGLVQLHRYSVEYGLKTRVAELKERDFRPTISERLGDRVSAATVDRVQEFARTTLGVIEKSVDILESKTKESEVDVSSKKDE
ncbi:MAG: hypothetical protein KVP17_004417 [Porospora cf. gigantea B]|uniref:uncharacterized protein n=1 Tax=Porospora cf. gigantea B TaxID=2853592 RepID=UPI003571D493|nr:MAG: hypothetical protein KVP17_004417 [Porospora cf. gigantea B]